MHSKAHAVILDQYPEIYSQASGKVQDAVKSSGLDRRRYSTWLYKVAESGITGTIDAVKLMPTYDFVDVLGYLSSKDKFTEEMMKK